MGELFLLVYDSIIPNVDWVTFIIVTRTLLSLVISVQRTPLQPRILSSKMQTNEHSISWNSFSLFWTSSGLFVCLFLYLLCLLTFYLLFFHFLGCLYSVEKLISSNFFMDFSSFSSQKCFLKKILWLQALLGMRTILTFLDVCLGKDMFGRTVVIARRLSSEIGRNDKKS